MNIIYIGAALAALFSYKPKADTTVSSDGSVITTTTLTPDIVDTTTQDVTIEKIEEIIKDDPTIIEVDPIITVDPITVIEKVGITTTTKKDDVVTQRTVTGTKTGDIYTYTEVSGHTELDVKDKVTFLEKEVTEEAKKKTVTSVISSIVEVSADTQKAATILQRRMDTLSAAGFQLGG